MTQAGLIQVVDYWKLDPMDVTWHCWRVERERMNLEWHVDLAPLRAELAKRKILKIEGEEILCWGYGT
jgi:hypothetical protein